MTPAAKPSMRFIAFSFGCLKKTTVAEPRAVISHVQSVAARAIQTYGFKEITRDHRMHGKGRTSAESLLQSVFKAAMI